MRRHESTCRRRGFAVIIVLALLSVTLALSYSMMRVQSTTNQIQQNLSRQSTARQAAISGLSAGIREMYESNWPGVDSTFSRNHGNHQSFEVRYEAGDRWLSASDPEYVEDPFRVTVISTGYAFDPIDPSIRSQYTVRAVMQLIRKKLQPSPSSWQDAAGHAMYAWGTGHSYIEAPCQIHGKLFVNGNFHLCEDWQTNTQPFLGLVDEVAIYNRELTFLDVLYMNLWGNGSNLATTSGMSLFGLHHWWRFNESSSAATIAADAAGGSHGAYRGGAVPGVTVGGDNRAVFLDGKTGRVDLGFLNLPNSNSFSVAVWVAPFGMTGNNAEGRIMSKATSFEENDHLWMLSTEPRGSRGAPTVGLKTDQEFFNRTVNNETLATNQWNLLVVTYNGSTERLTIYLRGAQIDQKKVKGDVLRDSSVMMWIGDNPPGSAISRYLEDLTRLANTNGGDYRPISGDVRISSDRTDLSTFLTLQKQLGCTGSFISTSVTTPSNPTFSGTTYRLFPGGKEYEIPLVSSNLTTTSLAPDAVTNPLGIFRCNSSIRLRDKVNVQGTLIAQGSGSDIEIEGNQITLQGLTLPALAGSDDLHQLPLLISADNVEIKERAEVSASGAITTFGSFSLDTFRDEAQFQMEGLVFTERFNLQSRKSWENLAQYATAHLNNFMSNVARWNPTANFATWLDETTSGKFEDRIKIQAPDSTTRYQWLDLSQPIYQPGDDDTGLVWDLVRWRDDGGT